MQVVFPISKKLNDFCQFVFYMILSEFKRFRIQGDSYLLRNNSNNILYVV